MDFLYVLKRLTRNPALLQWFLARQTIAYIKQFVVHDP